MQHKLRAREDSKVTIRNKNRRTIVRIGFDLPDANVHDVTGYCAAEMAIEAANQREDLPFSIELVPIIDERDPDVARRVAQQFVDDPLAVGILGPLNSAMALSSLDVYHEAGMAQLTSEASSPLLTSRGYNNFFRLVANDEYQGRDLAKVATLYLGARRIAVLHDSSAWGKPIAEIFAAEAERLGSKLVLFYGFGEKEQRLDFGGMVQATLDTRPELVYFAVYWNKAHIIAHKLRFAGLTATFLGSDALKPYAFLEVPSLDVVKPYHSLAGVDFRLKPSARRFLSEFAVRYPLMLAAPQYAAEAHDCACLLIEALKRAGTADRAKVLKELQSIDDFVGAIGPIRFDERGDLIDPEIGLYQCENGLRRYIGAIRDLTR
jgi:branched-chain amino acid transport system substrate-binding protein